MRKLSLIPQHSKSKEAELVYRAEDELEEIHERLYRLRVDEMARGPPKVSGFPLLFLPKHCLGQLVYLLNAAATQRLSLACRHLFHFTMVIAICKRRRATELAQSHCRLPEQIELRENRLQDIAAASHTLCTLHRSDLQELRNMRNPTREVHRLLHAVGVLLGSVTLAEKPTRSLAKTAAVRGRFVTSASTDRPATPTRRAPSRSRDASPSRASPSRASAESGTSFSWMTARQMMHDATRFLNGILDRSKKFADMDGAPRHMFSEIWASHNLGKADVRQMPIAARHVWALLNALYRFHEVTSEFSSIVKQEQQLVQMCSMLQKVQFPADSSSLLAYFERCQPIKSHTYDFEEDNLIYFPMNCHHPDTFEAAL